MEILLKHWLFLLFNNLFLTPVFFYQGETLSKIVRLFNDYDQKQQTLDICLSTKLDRLNIQCVSNDINDENKGLNNKNEILFCFYLIWFYRKLESYM